MAILGNGCKFVNSKKDSKVYSNLSQNKIYYTDIMVALNYKSILLTLFFTLFFTLSLTLTHAQTWEFGFGFGTTNYTGDISPSYKLNNSRPAGEFFVRLNPSPTFSVRIGAMIGAIRADETKSKDPFFQRRGGKFSANIYEASARMEYNFRDYRAMSELTRLSPYIFLGGSIAHISVNSNYFDNQPKTLELSLPIGVGIKYMLANNINLGFEVGARPTFTDALDGMLKDGSEDEISSVGKFQMTNIFTKDMYYYTGISLSTTINRVVCPIQFR